MLAIPNMVLHLVLQLGPACWSCTLNSQNKITFPPWEKIVSFEKRRRGERRQKLIRKLKSNKDERTAPMSKALYEAIKDIPLIK